MQKMLQTPADPLRRCLVGPKVFLAWFTRGCTSGTRVYAGVRLWTMSAACVGCFRWVFRFWAAGSRPAHPRGAQCPSLLDPDPVFSLILSTGLKSASARLDDVILQINLRKSNNRTHLKEKKKIKVTNEVICDK